MDFQTGSIIVVFAGAMALLWSALSTMMVWESRRFTKVRHSQGLANHPIPPRVSLSVCCKGAEPGLERALSLFFRQDYPNFEIVFVVESRSDPAFRMIKRLIRSHTAVEARIEIAGLAFDCGQKVHNLRQATRSLDPECQVLAFADSDIRPHRSWLSCLVNRVFDRGLGAVTGYRWMVPTRRSLINYLVYSINNAVVSALGPGGNYLVWGGSWAIRRDVFEKVGIRQAWHGTLSDDLVASKALKRAGLRIEFEPRCLCPSYFDFRLVTAWEFLRRQLLISRKYVPRIWWSVFLVSLVTQIGWWGLLGLGLLNGIASWTGWLCLGTLGLIAALNVVKGHWRQQICQMRFPLLYRRFGWERQFDVYSYPLAAPVQLLVMLSAMFGSEIAWRGIYYHIMPGGKISLLGRRPDSIDDPGQSQANEAEPRQAG